MDRLADAMSVWLQFRADGSESTDELLAANGHLGFLQSFQHQLSVTALPEMPWFEWNRVWI